MSLNPIVIVSIPKSGTHLLIKLVEAMGYYRGGPIIAAPRPGFWYMLSPTNTHTNTTILQQTEPYHPFVEMPALFMYRNPLDIVVSAASYWNIDGNTSFWSYYSNLNQEERILAFIDDPWLLQSVRDRMCSFIGWMDIKNVIPISFEELIGAQGGGDDDMQAKTISSVLKKLHIDADPYMLGKRLFDKASPTFRSGKIGSYKSVFTEKCYRKFAGLNQDFMAAMGYAPVTVDSSGVVAVDHKHVFSSRIDEFRSRPLILSTAHAGNVPHLIENNVFGHNLVLYRQRYYALPQAAGEIDLAQLGERELSTLLSEDNLEALRLRVMQGDTMQLKVEAQAHNLSEPADGLLVEGFHGFNIIRWQKKYYGFDQSVGAVDIGELGKDALDRLREQRLCVIGDSRVTVKESILNIAYMNHDKGSFITRFIKNVFARIF